jgi:hypothetical protein
MELLRDYMIDNHINHTFWCLNPNSGDTGGLLGYDFMTIDDEKYELFEPSLWQTSKTGKYISLDHKTALGSNGISLSEYYSTYVSSEGSNLDAGGEKHPLEGGVIPAETSETTAAAESETTDETTSSGSENVKATLLGDVTCDGGVNVLDVTMLKQYVVKIHTLNAQQSANADVISDGTIDVKDLGQLIKYIIKVIDKF